MLPAACLPAGTGTDAVDAMEEREKKVLASLQRRCSAMECCPRDIGRKALKMLDGDSEAAGRVVASLMEENYLNELRYASAFAREKASLSGWGPVKIAYALAGKGISKQTADEALAAVDADAAEGRMLKTLEAKYRTLEGDPQLRLKMLKFALGRGYEYEEAAAAVDKILKTNGTDI